MKNKTRGRKGRGNFCIEYLQLTSTTSLFAFFPHIFLPTFFLFLQFFTFLCLFLILTGFYASIEHFKSWSIHKTVRGEQNSGIISASSVAIRNSISTKRSSRDFLWSLFFINCNIVPPKINFNYLKNKTRAGSIYCASRKVVFQIFFCAIGNLGRFYMIPNWFLIIWPYLDQGRGLILAPPPSISALRHLRHLRNWC